MLRTNSFVISLHGVHCPPPPCEPHSLSGISTGTTKEVIERVGLQIHQELHLMVTTSHDSDDETHIKNIFNSSIHSTYMN